jgi:hypothetical protein
MDNLYKVYHSSLEMHVFARAKKIAVTASWQRRISMWDNKIEMFFLLGPGLR